MRIRTLTDPWQCCPCAAPTAKRPPADTRASHGDLERVHHPGHSGSSPCRHYLFFFGWLRENTLIERRIGDEAFEPIVLVLELA
jgi:hypothetical protein